MTSATGLIERLAGLGQTVATCESITGGLIGAALTDVPGSSLVVRGGLIVYATDLKTVLAGVDPGVIADEGVVSRAVAEAMADGARRICRADWGIAVTGVAGPGPSDGQPAGTVWLALVGPSGRRTRRLDLGGDRSAVRRATVVAAIDGLDDLLEADTRGHGGTAVARHR